MVLYKTRNYAKGIKTKNIVFRVTEEEMEIIKAKAEKYTGGNISDLVRHTVMQWKPTQKNKKIYQ